MEKFKVEDCLVTVYSYGMSQDVWGKRLVVRVNYKNCWGTVKQMYVPLSEETDDSLINKGILKPKDILVHLREAFLIERKKTKNRRLFDKAHTVINN